MKKLAGIVGAVGVSLLFSGCFVMRTLVYTDDTVDAGKKTTAIITVMGDSDDDYPFFFFSAESDSRLANGGKFDSEGVVGNPVALKLDPFLATAASEDCFNTIAARKQGPPDPTAVVTQNPFQISNGRKIITARVPIKASAFGNGDGFGIFMGTWSDDGDGTPEAPDSSDDEYDCQPPYLSTIRIKGGGPPPP